jgi:hypothetical protein
VIFFERGDFHMFPAIVVGLVCLAIGFGVGHFMTAAKIASIHKELDAVPGFVSSETRALATKIRGLL